MLIEYQAKVVKLDYDFTVKHEDVSDEFSSLVNIHKVNSSFFNILLNQKVHWLGLLYHQNKLSYPRHLAQVMNSLIFWVLLFFVMVVVEIIDLRSSLTVHVVNEPLVFLFLHRFVHLSCGYHWSRGYLYTLPWKCNQIFKEIVDVLLSKIYLRLDFKYRA